MLSTGHPIVTHLSGNVFAGSLPSSESIRHNVLSILHYYSIKGEIMSIVGMELPQKTGQWRLLLNAAVNITYSGPIKRGKLLGQVRYFSLLKDILLHGARDKYCLPASQLAGAEVPGIESRLLHEVRYQLKAVSSVLCNTFRLPRNSRNCLVENTF
jgi:hypothetical protein